MTSLFSQPTRLNGPAERKYAPGRPSESGVHPILRFPEKKQNPRPPEA